MRERRDCGRLLSAALFITLAAPACGGGSGGAGSQFCGEWATAFCRKVWACTADPASNPFAGSSEAECTRGYAALCAQPQPAGQTFDVNCVGKQVNQAAKTSCLNKLSTVSCDDFNSATYDDDCDLVCTAGGTGGTGGGGTGGTGGTSGGGCGTTQPCGGSVVGTWAITDVCVTAPTTTDPNCPGATLSNLMITETGTLTFASGGTYSTSISATISYTEMTPATCISPATCADLAAAYVSQGASATCSGTSVCTCTVSLASTGAETGTYTTSGTSLTVTPSLGTADTMGYCVQGDTLRFLHFDSAGQLTTEEITQRQ
jgi:hypothetical protein